MLRGFYCPHCSAKNACDRKTCEPYIKEGEYINKWTEDGEAHICGKCNKVFSPDQALDEEFKNRQPLTTR